MGVYCGLYSVTPEQIAAIARRPALAQLLWTDPGWESGRSLISRLFSRPTPACMKNLSESMSINLDKAWHGLHYLFSGVSGDAPLPQGFLLSGGKALGRGSRLVEPEQAREFGIFVRSLQLPSLRSHFQPAEMHALQIYPDIIWERDGNDALEWLLEFFDLLPPFFRDIEAEGHGYVLSIG